MTDSRIRLGIISCGYITGAHLRGLHILRKHGYTDFEVTALCSRKAENALRWVERGKGPAPLPPVSPWQNDPLNVRDVWVRDFQPESPRIYTDYEELLRAGVVDAVLVLSAVFMHHTIASEALNNGIHVFMEKPFTLTTRAARRLIEQAESKHLTLGVAENLRYMEGTRASGWATRSGMLGDLQMILSGGIGNVWSPDHVVARTAWRHRKLEAGGGGTLDIGAHLFDQLRYQCGEIDQVSALARTMEPLRYIRDAQGAVIEQVACDADDTFMALLQFHSGAIGNVVFSWAGHGEHTGFSDGGAIYGARGSLKGGRLTLDGQPAQDVLQLFRQQTSTQQQTQFFPHGIKDSFALELGEFLTAVEQSRQPETNGIEGLKDIAPGLAILESSALNRPVSVADVEEGRLETYQQPINDHWGIR